MYTWIRCICDQLILCKCGYFHKISMHYTHEKSEGHIMSGFAFVNVQFITNYSLQEFH